MAAGVRTADWTEADQAELDLLIHEFVDAVALHHERCSTCRETGRWCPLLGSACDVLLRWRSWRMRATRADRLRAGQDLVDAAALVGIDREELASMRRRWCEEDAALAAPQEVAA